MEETLPQLLDWEQGIHYAYLSLAVEFAKVCLLHAYWQISNSAGFKKKVIQQVSTPENKYKKRLRRKHNDGRDVQKLNVNLLNESAQVFCSYCGP